MKYGIWATCPGMHDIYPPGWVSGWHFDQRTTRARFDTAAKAEYAARKAKRDINPAYRYSVRRLPR